MKVLMVLTPRDRPGETGKKAGLWMEDFAAPYYMFRDAGAGIVLTSPRGGQSPLDPKRGSAAQMVHADRRIIGSTCKGAVVRSDRRRNAPLPGDRRP